MKKRIFIAVALLANSLLVVAQTSPGFYTGQIPTAAQWNSYFSGKVDYGINGVPVYSGGTGQISLTQNAILTGNGISPISGIPPTTNGNIIASNGTSWLSMPPATDNIVTNTTLNGGTLPASVTTLTATSINGVPTDSTTNKPITAASLNGGTLPASFTTLITTGEHTVGPITTASIANNTATTIFDVSSIGIGVYVVGVNLLPDTTSADYQLAAIISYAGSANANISVLAKGALSNLTISGTAVQVTQTSGSSHTMQYTYLRIF
jgi:hypothetical protein